MSVTDDDRLFGLLVGLRQRMGEGVLADPGRLSAMLNNEAPELRAGTRGLVAALHMKAATRVLAAADPAAAAQDCAAKLAAETRLSLDQALRAVHLAVRVSGNGAQAAPPPALQLSTADWVGLSVPAGAAPTASAPTAPPTPANDLWGTLKRRWVLVVICVIVAVGGLQQLRVPVAPGPGQPAPGAGPSPAAPPGDGGLPILAADPQGRLPIITARAIQGGVAMDFRVSIPNGMLLGRVLVAEDWQSGKVFFGRPGSDQPESISLPGTFQLIQTGDLTARLLQPQWQRDGVSAGPICLMFIGPHAADIKVPGSRLCLAEAVNRECQKAIGCGTVG